MVVTPQDIQQALRTLGLSGQAICLHSSLRSFGRVDGGATTVIRSFLDEGCTLLVPTFSSVFEVTPPPYLQFERNGCNYAAATTNPTQDAGRVYTPEVSDIDRYMGVVPAAVLARPDCVRGNHPLNSFTAVGPQAVRLIAKQTPSDVYGPLTALAEIKGFVLLMGVGFERMTLLHLAEKEAGRILFRRWANDWQDGPVAVEVGSCSEGFGNLEPYLRPFTRVTTVGSSRWMLLRADQALASVSAAIRENPHITHCSVRTCERCEDAVKGGPILPASQS
jgi:aminoglycoside 3-N-acetyltransferase